MQLRHLLTTLEAAMRHSGVGTLDLRIGEAQIALTLGAEAAAAPIPAAAASMPPAGIRSNRAGQFLPLTSGLVKSGQVVGVIEVGVLRFPVTAPADCAISPAQDAETRVEFGDTLFTIEAGPHA